MILSVAKSKWMIFGSLPDPTPRLYAGGEVMELVDRYKYVGVTFRSTHYYIFASHYHLKAPKARNVANRIPVRHR